MRQCVHEPGRLVGQLLQLGGCYGGNHRISILSPDLGRRCIIEEIQLDIKLTGDQAPRLELSPQPLLDESPPTRRTRWGSSSIKTGIWDLNFSTSNSSCTSNTWPNLIPLNRTGAPTLRRRPSLRPRCAGSRQRSRYSKDPRVLERSMNFLPGSEAVNKGSTSSPTNSCTGSPPVTGSTAM